MLIILFAFSYFPKKCASRLLKAAPSKDAAATSQEDLEAMDLLATERLIALYGAPGAAAESSKVAATKWIETQ
jgi:hypothetical protein